MKSQIERLFVFLLVLFVQHSVSAAETRKKFRSHAPVRPLPAAGMRPLEEGPTYFVDPVAGEDASEGSRERPWRTVQQGVERLQPGDTLCLRGGVYYEHVSLACQGEPRRPITLRAFPGELAVLDGGLREFADDPAASWAPCPGGVAGEFWSTKTYPELGTTPDGVNVRGNFTDSLVPLQGYRYLKDLRDESMAWDIENKVAEEEGVYCGPGVFYDTATGRVHIRLAHTGIKALGDDNYRGETDPRKLPLVVAGVRDGPVLSVRDARDVRFQDLVVRGSATATVEVAESVRLVFDGLTVYGGHTAFQVRDTAGLRLWHTACRGVAAPWTFRGHLKYRSTEARLFSASGWTPTGADNRDFELAWCEFTDSVDGVFIGNVGTVHFHHNLLDNVSDDGIFLTAATAYDGTTPGGNVSIYQNYLARCLTTFAFGVGHGRQKVTSKGIQTGSGVTITRNVFDFRRPVMYQIPTDPEQAAELTSKGRFASDHGSPAWEPMAIYHNTIVADDSAGYGTAGLGDHVGGAARRVFNNIIAQVNGMPGQTLPDINLPEVGVPEPGEDAGREGKEGDEVDALLDEDLGLERKEKEFSAEVDPDAVRKLAQTVRSRPPAPPTDFQADANLFWSLAKGQDEQGEFLAAFRRSEAFATSKRLYAPGWTIHDRFADPRFAALPADWRKPCNLTLQPGSPAIDAGLDLPAEWPDPVRDMDRGKPDIGALPRRAEPWRVGVRGRLTMFGGAAPQIEAIETAPRPFAADEEHARVYQDRKPAAIVEGYPEFDAPLLEFALRKQGAQVDRLPPGTWLPPRDYGKYRCVIIAGDLQRAGAMPDRYTAGELSDVREFLHDGGALLLVRRGKRVFDNTPEGLQFVRDLAGEPPREQDDRVRMAVQLAEHPWVAHLQSAECSWLEWRPDRDTAPWRALRGERILASDGGTCLLYRLAVGGGQLIYLGLQVAASQPSGRTAGTLEQERAFAEQMEILQRIAADLYPMPRETP